MIYTEQTKKAMDIAYRAHHGQVDKGGVPYVFHPCHLAEQMETETEVVASLLHDVIEDSYYSITHLQAAGFSDEALEAVALLTHNKNEPYIDYIRRLSTNPVARKIKLADIQHNSDESRLAECSQEEITRLRNKYATALEILMADKNDIDEGSFANG